MNGVGRPIRLPPESPVSLIGASPRNAPRRTPSDAALAAAAAAAAAAGSGVPPLARRPVVPVAGLVIGQQVPGVSAAMQRAQDEAEIRTLTGQVRLRG